MGWKAVANLCRILTVRAKLYDLLTHCIPATVILKTLTFKLVNGVDDVLKPEVIKWSAFYEHRLHQGSKVIFHLEAFVAKFLRIIEGYVILFKKTGARANGCRYFMGMDF